MAAVTIRNLPDETHRALRARAAAHGRSTEAEIRERINASVAEDGGPRLGTLLASLGREVVGVESERADSAYEPLDLR